MALLSNGLFGAIAGKNPYSQLNCTGSPQRVIACALPDRARVTPSRRSADISATEFLSATPFPFSYAGTLAPQPSPAWYIAQWIQEIPRIANGTGCSNTTSLCEGSWRGSVAGR